MTDNNNQITQTESLKPSLLDYIAQSGLNSLFHPIVRKLVHRLADRNKQFSVLKEWFEEYFALTNALLQFYYLKNYSATLSEKIYGLQRVSVNNSIKLGKKELLLSLFAESVFPYLLIKLRNSADNIIFDELPNENQKKKIIFMKSVIYLNNGINILYSLFTFVQFLRYLGDTTDYMCPAHWIARVKLIYSNEMFQEMPFKNMIPHFIGKGIELFAFLAQFFHLWEENKGGNFTSVPVPPPPKKNTRAISMSDKCPICLKKRKIDTVLTVSGFVFCFECITKHLMEKNQCPVTKLPATVDHIIRVRAAT